MVSSQDIADIPLINFEPYLHGSIADRERVAASIDAGLSSTGFIYLKNHGIDQRKIDECFTWSKRFFALAEPLKKLVQGSPARSQYHGYSGVGNLKVREHICMKERFACGNPKDDTQPNIWPSEDLLPGFRKHMEAFFEVISQWKEDCAKFIHHLLDCLSLVLKLSSTESLSGFHAKSLFNFDLLHYPAIPAQLLRSGTLSRIPAHSDLGTLTLLFQDSIGGLEIADLRSANTEKSAEFEKLGTFRQITPVPDTVIVNVGYLLMRWSNGRWKNTIHRVVEPPLLSEGMELVESGAAKDVGTDCGTQEETTPARYSIPFFSFPDPDTIVEALPGCWSEDMPKRWKPIHAGNYRRRKREGMYA